MPSDLRHPTTKVKPVNRWHGSIEHDRPDSRTGVVSNARDPSGTNDRTGSILIHRGCDHLRKPTEKAALSVVMNPKAERKEDQHGQCSTIPTLPVETGGERARRDAFATLCLDTETGQTEAAAMQLPHLRSDKRRKKHPLSVEASKTEAAMHLPHFLSLSRTTSRPADRRRRWVLSLPR